MGGDYGGWIEQKEKKKTHGRGQQCGDSLGVGEYKVTKW